MRVLTGVTRTNRERLVGAPCTPQDAQAKDVPPLAKAAGVVKVQVAECSLKSKSVEERVSVMLVSRDLDSFNPVGSALQALDSGLPALAERTTPMQIDLVSEEEEKESESDADLVTTLAQAADDYLQQTKAFALELVVMSGYLDKSAQSLLAMRATTRVLFKCVLQRIKLQQANEPTASRLYSLLGPLCTMNGIGEVDNYVNEHYAALNTAVYVMRTGNSLQNLQGSSGLLTAANTLSPARASAEEIADVQQVFLALREQFATDPVGVTHMHLVLRSGQDDVQSSVLNNLMWGFVKGNATTLVQLRVDLTEPPAVAALQETLPNLQSLHLKISPRLLTQPLRRARKQIVRALPTMLRGANCPALGQLQLEAVPKSPYDKPELLPTELEKILASMQLQRARLNVSLLFLNLDDIQDNLPTAPPEQFRQLSIERASAQISSCPARILVLPNNKPLTVTELPPTSSSFDVQHLWAPAGINHEFQVLYANTTLLNATTAVIGQTLEQNGEQVYGANADPDKQVERVVNASGSLVIVGKRFAGTSPLLPDITEYVEEVPADPMDFAQWRNTVAFV